jgi:hypothetical protein
MRGIAFKKNRPINFPHIQLVHLSFQNRLLSEVEGVIKKGKLIVDAT